MTNLRIRPAVAALPRYVPSKTAPGAVKISSNEMPTPPSPAVLEAIARELETINRYPDLTAAPLREALAQRYGVGADQVCVGTGSSAILVAALSAVCQPGTQVVFPWRSFESYPIAVPSVGGDPVPVELLPDGTHDLDAMRAAITPDTVAVIVCSPNNPTGPALTYEEIAAFVADVPEDVMIIVDEAYIDFATKPGVRTAVPLIEDHPNVIVMRTFSKAHALAGVRVGYAIGEAEVIGAIQALLVPFGVNSLALAAALASLKDSEGVSRAVAEIIAERDRIIPALRDLGYDIPDSQSNFYLIRGDVYGLVEACARAWASSCAPSAWACASRSARASRTTSSCPSPPNLRAPRASARRGRARMGAPDESDAPIHSPRCSSLWNQQRDDQE